MKKTNSKKLSNRELLSVYHDMLLIRSFEERAGQLYGLGEIGGFCHLYSGQEAVIIGVERARKQGDQIITAYRDHGHALACGIEPQKIMSELLGRKDGVSKGKGGSMHMFDVEKKFYGWHGIVGAQVSIGTGLAFNNSYRDNNSICLTFLGDGAANQGQVYESFNMAALWNLPIIYIIENNQYAMGTSVERASAQTDFSQRGVSFGIEGKQVDGMDVIAVHEAVDQVLTKIRKTPAPYILEMKTYRYSGHSMSDPAKYRKREDVKKVRQTQDPIQSLQKQMVKDNLLDETKIKAIKLEIDAEIERIVKLSMDSQVPDISELKKHIYVEDSHAN